MSAPIFISYSSKDRDIAETICRALEARGHGCWIACRDVRAGENFQEAIVRALREARVMLLVFSGNANNSDEIKKELVLAGRHHVTVVPARVEDVVPSDAFTYELATRQWIDLFKDWEREIEQLSIQLGHILQTAKPGATDATATPVRPPSRIGPRPRAPNNVVMIGGALAVLLLAIGGAVLYLKPKPAPLPTPVSSVATQTPIPAPAAQTPGPAPKPEAAAAPVAKPIIPRSSTKKEVAMAPAAAPPAQPPSVQPPAAPAPSAAPPPAVSAADLDEAAWQTAVATDSRAGFADYVKSFSTGSHVQEARLRLANMILNAPVTGSSFDGAWQTSWSCPEFAGAPSFIYQFSGQVKDGVFHGIKGVKGQPSSLTVDGKIGADGVAAFSGQIVVGSSVAGLGTPRGTVVDYFALAQFQNNSGTGRRIAGRPCNLAFERQ